VTVRVLFHKHERDCHLKGKEWDGTERNRKITEINEIVLENLIQLPFMNGKQEWVISVINS
jgi:hypothetical protein